jgi:hypothetical protein
VAGGWLRETLEKIRQFFTLRGVDMEELITAASTTASAPIAGTATPGQGLEADALSDIFGVEIEAAPRAPVLHKRASKALPAKRAKPTTKAKGKVTAIAPKAKKKN